MQGSQTREIQTMSDDKLPTCRKVERLLLSRVCEAQYVTHYARAQFIAREIV
jgi:hypothetical protein